MLSMSKRGTGTMNQAINGLFCFVGRFLLICWSVSSIEIIGLFCKRALQKRLHSAKETYNFKEATNRSHPI